MRIIEGVKEPKAESITFRVSARYKSYLEKWAIDQDLTVGALINKWIRSHKHSEIGIKGRRYAHEKASEMFNIPLKMVERIETPDDWRGLKELIGQEKYDAYANQWHIFNSDEQDRIADEEGFVWSYDTPSGFPE